MYFFLYFLFFIFFSVGLYGLVTNRSNMVLSLICFEILLLSFTFFFLLCSFFYDDIVGVLFSIVLLCIGGCESAIGLALVVSYYRIHGTVSLYNLILLCG
jgi:NADH-ubiquinone oxidoreductase chain 4L